MKIRILTALFLFVLYANTKAQQDSVELKLLAFIENIHAFNQLYPQEKVYLHFDNTGYYLGETIWFKAYIVVAENNQPTVLSRVLYLELLDPNGDILETKKLKIENGQCHGEFFLKPERYGGFYEVRAYTRLMLNWEDTVFSRVFPVFDSPKKEGDYTKQTITERPRSQQTPSKRIKAGKQEKTGVRENYTMRIDSLQPDFLFVHLQRKENEPGEIAGLSILCRGKVYVFETLDMISQNEYLLKVPKSALPTGVNQLTAFTSKGEILAESRVFINHHDRQITITVKQNKAVYAPFEKIEMEFQLQDEFNHPVDASFSLSVSDAETSSFTDGKSMFSELFHPSGGHYDWKQIAGVEPFELKHYIEKGIVIDGQVLSLYRKKKKENTEVTMWMYSEEGFSQKGVCLTDDEGRFNFLPDDFTGEWKLGLQTKEKGKRKENRILLDRQFSPPAKVYSYSDIQIRRNIQLDTPLLIDNPEDEIKTNAMPVQSHLLPTLTVSKRRKAKNHISIEYNVEKELSKLDDEGVGYPGNIFNFLMRTNPYFHTRSSAISPFPMKLYKGKPVAFYVNDLAGGSVEEIQISEVKTIQISEDSGIYLDPLTGKLPVSVFIYTHNRKKIDPQGIRMTSLQGYSNVREFYAPDYSLGVLPDEKDYRRTLYWNPDVRTDGNGNVTVSFYNNAGCRQIDISAEGITADGMIISSKR